MKKQLFYLLLAAGVLSACGPAAPQLGKDSVEDVIGAMTLEGTFGYRYRNGGYFG